MRITLTEEAKKYVPSAILEADHLYLISTKNNKSFISTHENPNGHVCTFVWSNHVRPV